MILILGGSYQGKLDFAKSTFCLDENDIFICTDENEAIDFSKRCIAYVDRFALNRVRAGFEPAGALLDNPRLRPDAIVIATDISSGVVPMDAVQRAWREACGRMNNLLASRADEVWRVFCGIPQRIK